MTPIDKYYAVIYIAVGFVVSTLTLLVVLSPYADLQMLETRVRAPSGDTTQVVPSGNDSIATGSVRSSGWWIHVDVEWKKDNTSGQYLWRKKVSHTQVNYGLELRVFETCAVDLVSQRQECREVGDNKDGYTSNWTPFDPSQGALKYKEVIRLRYLSGNVRELASTIFVVQSPGQVAQPPAATVVSSPSPVISTPTPYVPPPTLQPLFTGIPSASPPGRSESSDLTVLQQITQDEEWAQEEKEQSFFGKIISFFVNLF